MKYRSSLTFALILVTLIAVSANAQPETHGFLTASNRPTLEQRFPPAPPAGSLEEQADVDGYLLTRGFIATPRGDAAAADDVYQPEEVALRFADALGGTLTDGNAENFMRMMRMVAVDMEDQTKSIKKSVTQGGRHRPILDHPDLPHCRLAYPSLPQTGSYPSGHAELGWLWAMSLAQLAPDRAEELFARGFDFGESRLVCGFHYSSDVIAGRFAATALFSALLDNKDFQDAMSKARSEIVAARAANLSSPRKNR